MIHSRSRKVNHVCERNMPGLTFNLPICFVFLTIPVVCRVSSKLSISGGSNNPKLYTIPIIITISIVEPAHTNHDQQLSGRHFGSFSSGAPRAFSISPLLFLEHFVMTPATTSLFVKNELLLHCSIYIKYLW